MGFLLETARRDAEIRASTEATGVLAARFGISPSVVSRVRSSTGRQLTNRERFQLEVIDGGWAAACMDPDDWKDWVKRNPIGLSHDAWIAVRPCHDCPAGFAAEMRSLRRCNGAPGTNNAAALQAVEEENDVQGEHWARKRADKAERVFAALRETPGYQEAADRLGVSRSAIEAAVRQYRIDGTLPADLDEIIKKRAATAGRPGVLRRAASLASTVDVKESAIEAEFVKPTGVQRAPHKHPDQVELAGIIPAHSPGNNPAPHSTLEDPEASAPATAAEVVVPATPTSPPGPTLVEALEIATRLARARTAMAAELAAFDRDLRQALDRAEAEMRKAIA